MQFLQDAKGMNGFGSINLRFLSIRRVILFEMDTTHPFVGAFKQAYKNARNQDVKIVGSPAGCDSRTWHNIVKCPTLQYGPGSLEQCHAVNEYVTVEQYLDAIKIYANLIMEWAKTDE